MIKRIWFGLFTCLTMISSLNAQQPRNRIKITVSVSLTAVGDSLSYDYMIANNRTAEQSVWKFWVITSDRINIINQKAPKGWRPAYGVSNGYLILSWGSPGDRDIMPDSSLTGFSFSSNGVPGIARFYAEGYTPPPSGENDSIPGYHDLTPYGPGIIGEIVAPVIPLFLTTINSFLDSLISYKHQAVSLGWIDNEGIANSLDQKLDNARNALIKNDKTSAKNILKAFVNEVEAQRDKHLSSEAYALLKFNAEYLISKL